MNDDSLLAWVAGKSTLLQVISGRVRTGEEASERGLPYHAPASPSPLLLLRPSRLALSSRPILFHVSRASRRGERSGAVQRQASRGGLLCTLRLRTRGKQHHHAMIQHESKAAASLDGQGKLPPARAIIISLILIIIVWVDDTFLSPPPRFIRTISTWRR